MRTNGRTSSPHRPTSRTHTVKERALRDHYFYNGHEYNRWEADYPPLYYLRDFSCHCLHSVIQQLLAHGVSIVKLFFPYQNESFCWITTTSRYRDAAAVFLAFPNCLKYFSPLVEVKITFRNRPRMIRDVLFCGSFQIHSFYFRWIVVFIKQMWFRSGQNLPSVLGTCSMISVHRCGFPIYLSSSIASWISPMHQPDICCSLDKWLMHWPRSLSVSSPIELEGACLVMDVERHGI